MADNKEPIVEPTVEAGKEPIGEPKAEEVKKSEPKEDKPQNPEEVKQDEKKQDEKEVVKEDDEITSIAKKFTKVELVTEVKNLKDDLEVFISRVADRDSEIAKLQAEIETLKSDISTHQEIKDKYVATMQSSIDEKMNNLSEEIKGLLPEGLDLEKKLAWVTKAQSTNKPKKETPNVEIGKPFNMGVPHQDTSKMTAQEKMSSYFASVFNK